MHRRTDAGPNLVDVAIVVLTWHQRDTTLRCLQSIQESGYSLGNVVVWDNGSDDGTIDAINSRFPKVITHRHATNLGVASGRNAAAKVAIDALHPTCLLFLDNDMTVTPGFVDRLFDPFLDDPKLGQTEARILMAGDHGRINAAGGSDVNFVYGTIKPVGYGQPDNGQYDKRRSCVPNGGAMMVRVNVFEELGGFDSIFDPYGPEDLDFSLRTAKAGYSALYVPDSIVYHDHDRSVEGGEFSSVYTANKIRNLLILMRRHATFRQKLAFVFWGAPIGFLRVVTREILKGNFGVIRGFLAGLRGAKRAQ